MRDLISEGIARLAGASSQAVFHLKQAMGGGKTHLLVGFGLLAKHESLRRRHCGDMLHATAFDTADIAAINGRNNPDHFFWGEIANQLGKGAQFKAFWTGGPKAPDEKDWLKLFDGDAPVAILLDEMPPYFHYLDTQKVGNGTVADIATRAFANLLTAAGKKKNVCVVVSDLAAAYDTQGASATRRPGAQAGDLRARLYLHHSQPVRQSPVSDPARRQAAAARGEAARHDTRRHQALQRRGATRKDSGVESAQALSRRRKGVRRQARRTVDMLNLVYHDTQDEKVYQVLSRRMRDRYDIFGGLPDTIEDEWIETIETLDEMMDTYMHLRRQARDVFEVRYQETIDPDKNRWELCSRVLARNDVVEKLSEAW